MNKTEKSEMVSLIKEKFEKSTAMYLVDYTGVTVEQISGLRREFNKEGVSYKVFKNSLVKRAIAELGGFEEINKQLVGMIGIAFADENYVAPAKIIKNFSDKSKKFNFKGCYIESTFYGEDQLKNLASMPTKEEVMSSIIGSIAAPASGIVGSINAVIRDLISVIDEAGKTKAA
ncbi:MAG: 50S ribosomal protein L10 [Bacteroidetes bacterium]|nr:50S ribosomal protein L10 [Bacteroidota bacterium]MBU1116042.1 50S ribosomal protein L10 [Bacteroidota bacterium]MBU1799190.1 50S ribosomal protein L10 [Bacteroidota bacterium]